MVEIGESADPLTGTYEVKLELDEAGAKMVTGFVADVDIYPTKCEPMPVVPVEALVEADGERGYVYVPNAEGTKVSKTAVTIGCLVDARVAIAHGLEDVGRVVTDGAAYLTDKAAIRIVDETPRQD